MGECTSAQIIESLMPLLLAVATALLPLLSYRSYKRGREMPRREEEQLREEHEKTKQELEAMRRSSPPPEAPR